MKRKMKGKLLLSIATLSLALVSSVGSTFAWFLMNENADLTGLDITVTTGSSVLLKDEDKSTTQQEIYSETFTIKGKDGAKWEMITPVSVTPATSDGVESGDATSMTVNSGFKQVDIADTISKGSWQYDNIDSKKVGKYDNTHVYGTTSAVDGTTSTTAYYYKIDFKYRVSKGYDVNIAITANSLKVTDKDDKQITDLGQNKQTVDKVIRVAFQDNNATTASVYRIAKTTETDFNKAQMNQLVTGATLNGDQYNCTLLSDNNKHKVTEPDGADYTNDKAFYYGTTSMYVWYDGTDHACSNAVFQQTCEFGVTFTAVEQTTADATD